MLHNAIYIIYYVKNIIYNVIFSPVSEVDYGSAGILLAFIFTLDLPFFA